jgi:lipoic acid synthetase
MYPLVRPEAGYQRSLTLLAKSAAYGALTKSGLMLGLGESSAEVRGTMTDLHTAGVKMITLGQYLQPSKAHLPVDRFVHPDEFERLKAEGLEMGFSQVEAGPLVRSSYHADEQFGVEKRSVPFASPGGGHKP